jgi:hypothetical protein
MLVDLSGVQVAGITRQAAMLVVLARLSHPTTPVICMARMKSATAPANPIADRLFAWSLAVLGVVKIDYGASAMVARRRGLPVGRWVTVC